MNNSTIPPYLASCIPHIRGGGLDSAQAMTLLVAALRWPRWQPGGWLGCLTQTCRSSQIRETVAGPTSQLEVLLSSYSYCRTLTANHTIRGKAAPDRMVECSLP